MSDLVKMYEADSDPVQQVVYAAIDELNQQLPAAEQLDRTADTPLFGEKATIDSMSLVTLIVSVEERLHSEFGRTITLASEKAMSRKRSPFLSVATLTEYIRECLDEGQSGEIRAAA